MFGGGRLWEKAKWQVAACFLGQYFFRSSSDFEMLAKDMSGKEEKLATR